MINIIGYTWSPNLQCLAGFSFDENVLKLNLGYVIEGKNIISWGSN